jgi:hypothetical protein
VSDQLLAFSIFAIAVLLLSVFMWPSPRRLNGQQKYRKNRRSGPDLDPNGNARSSVSPVTAFLGFLVGYGAANDSSGPSESDSGDAGDSGGGDAGGGGK